MLARISLRTVQHKIYECTGEQAPTWADYSGNIFLERRPENPEKQQVGIPDLLT
jgi:hypothetical protein